MSFMDPFPKFTLLDIALMATGASDQRSTSLQPQWARIYDYRQPEYKHAATSLPHEFREVDD